MADDGTADFPTVFNIPKGAIEGWLKIPSDEEVAVSVTRQDLDNLFFSINHLVSANFELQQCVISYSNGDLDSANGHMARSQKANTLGLNAIRHLFNALMSNAAAARNNNG